MKNPDENKSEARKRSSLLYAAALLGIVMILLMIASIFIFRQQIKNSTALMSTENTNEYSAYYVLVTEDEDTGFWNGILDGAREAAEEQGIYLEKAGAQMNAGYSKSEQMEMAIYSKADGIILDAGDSNSMTNLIHQAYQAGIPVVTVRNDNTASERVSYINVSNASLIREYGEQICRTAREKLSGKNGETLRVCILLDANDAGGGQNIVFSGIQDYINAHGLGEKLRLDSVQIQNDSAFSAEEEIRDLFMNSQSQIPADIMVCLNLQNTTCVYQTVLDYNLAGRVSIIGFYLSDTIRNALDKDIIQATIVVDTQQMGRYCVDALTEYRESGYTSDYYAVELSLLTSHDEQEGGSGNE